MTPEQIAETYNRIGHHWASDDFHQANGVAQHERALAFAQPGPAIDIGCGCNGRFFDVLIKHGYQPEGLDISERMIALAQERYPDLVLHHANICTWHSDQRYAFITAWDSIWHVLLDQQDAMLRKVLGLLAPGSVIISTTGGVQQPGSVTNPCHGEPLYHAALGVDRVVAMIREEGCELCHLEYDQQPQSHVYFIARKPLTG